MYPVYRAKSFKQGQNINKNCEIMSEKQVMQSFSYLYMGISLFFILSLLLTFDENYFFLNTLNNIMLILVALIIPIFMVFLGLRGLKKNGVKIDVKALKDVRLIPMLVGFVMMSIGIYFSSISQPNIYPDDRSINLFLHPFLSQGLVIFFVGTGIQLLEFVWYYDTVSSRILERTKQTPS